MSELFCPKLYLITDRKRSRKPLYEVIKEAAQAGIDAVQLREKDLSAKSLYGIAKDLKPFLKEKGVKLFINDRVDVALAVGADGVHLGGGSLPISVVKSIAASLIVGYSAHNVEEAMYAEKEGADFITLSPIFPTKKDYEAKPIGVSSIVEVRKKVNIPILALGGINLENIEDVLLSGAFGVAFIGLVFESDNPYNVVKKVLDKLYKVAM